MQQLKIYSKKWAAALLFIFSPILSFQETAAPGAAYVVVCLAVAFFVFLADNKKKLQTTHIFALLMWCFALFSTLVNGVPIDMHCIKYLLIIIIYIFLTISATGNLDMIRITTGYNYMSAILALLILLSFVAGIPHIESYVKASRYSIGITGLFKNPNYLVSFMLLTFYLLTFKLLYRKRPKKILFLPILLAILLLYAIFLTGTRAGLLCIGIILCYCLGGKVFFNFKKGIKSIIIIVLFCIILLVIFGDLIRPTIERYFQRDFFSDSLRISIWLAALEKYTSGSLLFGGGINTINEYLINTGHTYTHNIFLEMLCEQGIISFIFFFFVLLSGTSKMNKDDRFFYFGFLIILSVPLFFQNGFTEVNFWRYLLLNRLVINYSTNSQLGFVREIIFRDGTYKIKEITHVRSFSFNEHL